MKPREIVTPVGPSIAYVPLSQNMFSLIDADKVQAVRDFNWYAQWHPSTESFYAYRRGYFAGRRVSIAMHRSLRGMEYDDPNDCDHANLDTLDNRTANLRRATRSENQSNTRRSSRNKTGFKGVSYFIPKGKYRASITLNGIQHHLGYFENPTEAHAAYRSSASARYGQFARFN